MRMVLCLLLTVGLSSCDSKSIKEGISSTFAVCGTEVSASIQLVETNILAGARTIDAFRLTESGVLSRASWIDFGQFLGSSLPVLVGADVYNSSLSTLSEISLSNPPDDGTLRQPGGVSYEVSLVTSDVTEFQQGSLGVENLIPLVDDWSNQSPLINDSDAYYWARYTGKDDLNPSIDIDELGCEDPISQALISALSSDAVVLQLPEALSNYFDNNPSRAQFSASTSIGSIIFGRAPSITE